MRLGGDVLKLDLYGILGVTPLADAEAIRSAYRRRALRSHPDLQREAGQASEREMVDLNVAAWVLTDPELRRQYDRCRHGHAHQKPRAWYERVCYTSGDWVVPPQREREGARAGEFGDLLRRIRQWPGRVMLEIAERVDALSPRQRTTVTAVCLFTAVLLIGYAKPSSLTKLFEDNEPSAFDPGAP